MKILVVISAMEGGGAERVAANLMNAWAERGDSVTLLITYSKRSKCFYPLSEDVDVIQLADFLPSSRRDPLSYLKRFFALRRLIRDSHADVVISFLARGNVAVLAASLGLRLRIIASERTHPPMLPIGWIWATLRRLLYPSAAAVTVLTTDGLRWLNSEIPTARGAVIPNPVVLPLPASAPNVPPSTYVPTNARLVLGAGRLHEGKQFDQLIAAFAALSKSHPDWFLVILGEGSERSRLVRMIEDLNLRDRASMPGQVGNMSDWYERADLYVSSSRFEGFPNTLLEAMAHGCAPICYDCDTGPRDIIRHEHDGLLVRPVGDVGALTQALARLMGNDVERRHISAKAVEVKHRYSLSRILAMWDQLFAQTAN